MTCQWRVRAALTDERRARRTSPSAPAGKRSGFSRIVFVFNQGEEGLEGGGSE